MDLTKVSPLYLGGFEIPVVDESDKLKLAGLVGYYDGDEPSIQLRSVGVGEQSQAQTLLHEALHAVAYIFLEGEEVGERVVAGMSQGIFQLLADNPGFVDVITGCFPDHADEYADCTGCTIGEYCVCMDEPVLYPKREPGTWCFVCNRPNDVHPSLGGCVCESKSDDRAPTS